MTDAFYTCHTATRIIRVQFPICLVTVVVDECALARESLGLAAAEHQRPLHAALGKVLGARQERTRCRLRVQSSTLEAVRCTNV